MRSDLIDLEKEAACKAVQKYLHDYTEGIQQIQQKFYLSSKDIMSPKLIANPRLSDEEKGMLTNLRRNLDTIVNKVSVRVEERRVDSYDTYTAQYKLNAYDKLRVDTLVNAVRNINISIQKIKIIFLVFSYCNEVIRKEFDDCLKTNNLVDGRKLVLGNMLLIYELANYLISFLENFKLEGVNDVIDLSQKELRYIDEAMTALQNLKEEAGRINTEPPEVKDQVMSNLNYREESLASFKSEWEQYVTKIKDLQENVGNLGKQIPTLRLIRGNAQNQLAFFEIMKIFGVMMIAEAVEKSLGSLKIDLLPLNEIELISLPPDRVKTLTGLPQETGAPSQG
jgi:hypothetical protein